MYYNNIRFKEKDLQDIHKKSVKKIVKPLLSFDITKNKN